MHNKPVNTQAPRLAAAAEALIRRQQEQWRQRAACREKRDRQSPTELRWGYVLAVHTSYSIGERGGVPQ